MADQNAPVEGQPAAIVAHAKDGPYLARFPFEAAGGREAAMLAANRWRYHNAPKAVVLAFTGRIVHRLVWEE